MRSRARCIYQLRTFEGGLTLDLEPPASAVIATTRKPLYPQNLGPQASAPHEVIVPREVI